MAWLLMPADANSERALTTLLEELFDPEDLWQVISKLDKDLYNNLAGRDLGLSALVNEFVRKSVQRNLIDARLFHIVHRERPKQGPRIEEVARLWGVELKVQLPSPMPSLEPNAMPTLSPPAQSSEPDPEALPFTPSAEDAPSIRVFISYSHDSDEHSRRVLELADRLRKEGIDAHLDQYEPAPTQGWQRWMQQQIEQAQFVLLVCTPIFRRRFEGRESAGVGKGATWEGQLVTQEIYDAQMNNDKFLSLLLDGEDEEQALPIVLRPYTHYRINSRYEALYRRLTGQPEVVKRPLGEVKRLPPREVPPDGFSDAPAVRPAARATQERKRREPSITSSDSPVPPQRLVTPAPSYAIVEPVPMVDIPAGSFIMGSPDDSDDMAYDIEKPAHQVHLSAFRCMVTSVTRAQWAKEMGVGHKWYPEGPDDDWPANNITWFDAVHFCNALSKKSSLESCYRIDGDTVDWVSSEGYRLPTEAEWEYACRAGSQGRYCYGYDPAELGDYAWFEDNSNDKPHPVSQKRANAWGLYDMHGNVWEWCWDWYSPYPSQIQENPRGPSDANAPIAPKQHGKARLLRGGSASNYDEQLRCAHRFMRLPSRRHKLAGLRVVQRAHRQR